MLPTGGEIPQLKPVNMNRPRLAPPGKKNSFFLKQIISYSSPFVSTDKSISNGQSNESINSLNEGQNSSRVQSGSTLRKVMKFLEAKKFFEN